MKKNILSIYILLAITVFFISSCSREKNTPPEILSIYPSTVLVSSTVQLSVHAIDNDEDELSYQWSVNNNSGSLGTVTTQNIVNWTTPGTPGIYNVTVEVSDDVETAYRTESIEVIERSYDRAQLNGYVMDITLLADSLYFLAAYGEFYKLHFFVSGALICENTDCVVSDDHGYYLYPQLEYDYHTFTVTHDNYYTLTDSVFTVSDTCHKNFYLTRLPVPYWLLVIPDTIYLSNDITSRNIFILSRGTNSSSWTALCNDSWLSTTPTYGAGVSGNADTMRIELDYRSLPEGVYYSWVKINSPEAVDDSILVISEISSYCDFEITPDMLSFDINNTSGSIIITNTGTMNLVGNLSKDREWMSLSSDDVDLAPAEAETIYVDIDLSVIDYGHFSGNIQFSSLDCGYESIPVYLDYTCRMRVLPDSLFFSMDDSVLYVELSNSCLENIGWNMALLPSWISANHSSGMLLEDDADSIAFTVNRSEISGLFVEDNIFIYSNIGLDSYVDTISISAENHFIGPMIDFDDTLWIYSYEDSKSFRIRNTGSETAHWATHDTESWMVLDPFTGYLDSGEDTICTISVSRTGLGIGNYYGIIYLTSASEVYDSMVVVLEVAIDHSRHITVEPGNIDFDSVTVEAPLRIINDGYGSVIWMCNDNRSWINTSTTFGSLAEGEEDTIYVDVDRSILSAGDYDGFVNVYLSEDTEITDTCFINLEVVEEDTISTY